MLDLAGADAEGERTESAVGGGMTVSADDGHPGLGQTELGADDVDDALLGVAHRIDLDTELCTVAAQGLDLGQAHRVGDRTRGGRDVMVLGGQRQLGATHLAAAEPQAVEGLRTGDLVDQVEIDVEDVRLAVGAANHMVRPNLFGQRACHHCLQEMRARTRRPGQARTGLGPQNLRLRQ